MYLIVILTLIAPAVSSAVELEPIIFASKSEITTEKMTSSVEVIESESLERTSGARLTEKLQASSSLTISKTGVTAGQASVFIRGLEARHTVFAINGVRIYDAASIQKILNPSTLNSAHIERIEILKGAQSVLYGSDAIGGVVNIITAKQDLKSTLIVEHGIYSSYQVSQNALVGNFLLNFSGFYQEDLGHNDLTIGSELDSKINKGASVELSYAGVKWESQTQLKLSNDFSENDGQNFTTDLPFDAEDNHVDTTQFFGTQKIKYLQNKDSTFVLDLGLQNSSRVNKTTDSEFVYNGEVRQAELKWLGEDSLLGAAIVQEIYSDNEISDKELNNADLFFQLSENLGSYLGEFGMRSTSNKFYGEYLVYNLGLSKRITKQQTLSLSQKSGFSAPSSYQLFGKSSFGDVGNEDLAPERSVSIELSHQYKTKNFTTGVSLFQTKVEDHIDFENNRYENIDGSFYQGVELDLTYARDKIFGGVNATLIDYYLSSGEEPERRPRETIKINLGKKLSVTSEISLRYRYVGVRYEDISGRSEILSAYDVVDLNYSKTLGDYRLGVEVNNLFDEVYEEAYLYATNRFGVQGSLTYTY